MTSDDEKLTRRGIVLSEQQWRLVKAHAAQRGQTISEWFQDMVKEAGLGQSPTAKYPTPVTDRVIQAVPEQTDTRAFTPAPKPGGKKR